MCYCDKDLPKEIEEKITKTKTCWIWDTNSPYGAYKGKPAHRVVYELLEGEIPPNMVLDHLCMRKRCVNPAHLEPVTEGENGRRAAEFYKKEKLPVYDEAYYGRFVKVYKL